jgi:hypothetical protein
MGPAVKLEKIARARWRVSVVRMHRVTSAAEGSRKRIAKLAGRAMRLLHRWDLLPEEEFRPESQSGAFQVRPWLKRRYVVYQHPGDPCVISQVLASFATFELAQVFLWSELDHGSVGVAILDQATSEVILDPMPDPVRTKRFGSG